MIYLRFGEVDDGFAIEGFYNWCRDCGRMADGYVVPEHRYAMKQAVYVCDRCAGSRVALGALDKVVNG